MADWTLPLQSVSEKRDHFVLITPFEEMSEQRLKISSHIPHRLKCKSPALTATQATAYETFFDSKGGAESSFTFDLYRDSVTYLVRFIPGTFELIQRKGYWTCQFELKVFGVN